MKAKRQTANVLRTAEQARQWLIDNGLSVSAFAKAHGLSRDAVNNAMRSGAKCRVGKTHEAAVALGMKARPDSHTQSLTSTPIRARGRGTAGKKADAGGSVFTGTGS